MFQKLREDQGQEEQEDKLSNGGRVVYQRKRRARRRRRDLGGGEGPGGGWGLGRLGREPAGGRVMARLLRALRGLPLRQAPGQLARGCAGSGRGDTGRSSVAVSLSWLSVSQSWLTRGGLRLGPESLVPAALCCRSCRAEHRGRQAWCAGGALRSERFEFSPMLAHSSFICYILVHRIVSGAMVVSGTQWRSTAVPRAPSPGRELILGPVHLFPEDCWLPPVRCDWPTAASWVLLQRYLGFV